MTEGEHPGREAGATSKAEQARRVTQRAFEELSAQLDQGNSAQLDAFFAAMGRFHQYSFHNIMLIVSQREDATRVAGFHTWKSLGRSVKKGEKGIMIFAPMMLKDRKNTIKNDPERDDKGRRLCFRVVHVFDIAQTEGDPLPELDRIGGDPGGALFRLESAIATAGITVETCTDLGGAEGRSSGGTIAVLEGIPLAERFSVLVHEWAHEMLHQVKGDNRPAKAVRETEAEAVGFVVSRAIGLETGTASADYIRLYRGDTETLTGSLDRIQRTACRIIEAVAGPEGEGPEGKRPATKHATATVMEHLHQHQR